MDKIGFLKFRDEEAAHLVNGKVPASELPSYVDDVIEGYLYEGSFYEESTHTTLITPEMGKIYVDIQTGYTYRWSGSTYIRINDIDTSMFPRKSRYRFLLQDENYVVSNMYGFGPDGQILSPYTVVETLTDLVASKRIATFECLDENGETIILPNIYHIRGTYPSQECTLIVSGFSKNGEIITFSHTGSGDYFTKTVTSKLDKNQGSENAGKFMKIGTDGNLTPDIVVIPAGSYVITGNEPSSGTAITIDNTITTSDIVNAYSNGKEIELAITNNGSSNKEYYTLHKYTSELVDFAEATANAYCITDVYNSYKNQKFFQFMSNGALIQVGCDPLNNFHIDGNRISAQRNGSWNRFSYCKSTNNGQTWTSYWVSSCYEFVDAVNVISNCGIGTAVSVNNVYDPDNSTKHSFYFSNILNSSGIKAREIRLVAFNTYPTASFTDTSIITINTSRVSLTSPTTLTVADNTLYSLTDVNTLTITVPDVAMCHIFATTTSSGTPSITFSGHTAYSGDNLSTIAAGDIWEFSIIDGFIVGKKWEVATS